MARRFVAELLGDAHPCVDSAVLLTSELATNAVCHRSAEHGDDAFFLVSVLLHGAQATISVHDHGSEKIPHIRMVTTDATGGRGIALVDQIAARWGFSRDASGTRVWFEVGGPEPLVRARDKPQEFIARPHMEIITFGSLAV